MRGVQARRSCTPSSIATALCIVIAMPVSKILLRLLLCLCLILDGTGAAFAATRGPLPHAPVAKASPVAMAMATMPCGDHAGMAATPQRMAMAAISGDARSMPSKHALPDCCKSGHCSCACTQQGMATLAWLAMPGASIGHANAVSAIATAHPAPALPHLMRPPLG